MVQSRPKARITPFLYALAGALCLASFAAGAAVTSSVAWASTPSPASIPVANLDPNLRYTGEIATNPLDRDSFLAELSLKLQTQGLYSVRFQQDSGAKALTVNRLDAIFASADLEHAVFVKFGVTISSKRSLGKLLRTDGGYAFHGVTASGVPYASFFSGFSERNARAIAFSMKVAERAPTHSKSFIARVLNVLSDTLIPPAYADESCATPNSPLGDSLAAMSRYESDISSFVSENPYIQGSYGCVIGALKGAWGITGGMVTGTAEGLWHLTTNFKGTVSKAWGSVQKTWGVVKAFYNHFEGESAKLYRGFASLPAKTRSQIACTVAMMVGGGALIAFVSGQLADSALALAIRNALSGLLKGTQFASLLKPLAVAEEGSQEAAAAEGAASAAAVTSHAAPIARNVASNVASNITSDITSNRELKTILSSSGVPDSEQTLQKISRIAQTPPGQAVTPQERFTVVDALRGMSSSQQKRFEQTLLKVSDREIAGASSTASGSKTASSAGAVMKHEIAHDQRILAIESDPTAYPSLTKLHLSVRDEDTVADTIANEESRGFPPKKIDNALKDAEKSCGAGALR